MKKSKLNYKKIVYPVLLVIVIILIFTLIDYTVHSLSEKYAVPSYYFKNKITYGTIFGLIAYFIARKMNWIKKSFVVSGIVAVLLQIRYAFEGYALKFVLEFLVLHFIMILVPSLIVFKWFEKEKI